MPTNGRRGGSTPDPTVVDRVLEAVLDELVESGRDRLSMDRVAARAGVSKTTVYTRWSTKDELLTAAYRASSSAFPNIDTGTLRGDLDRLLEFVIAGAAERRYGVVMAELLAASATNPALRPELDAHSENWNSGIQDMLRAGQVRGELDDDVDIGFLAEVIVSVTLGRLLFQHPPIDDTLPADIARLVLDSPPRVR